MAITQLSVFLENKPGKLADAVEAISQAGINIRAMSIADTRDFGILRLIVSDLSAAKKVLSGGSIVLDTSVIAVKMDDRAGALSHVLKVLDKNMINVEYMYAFTASGKDSAYVVFRVDDINHAEAALNGDGISTLSDSELMSML
ncbi:MAG: ACT domain-containing protein [Oscillospiraceae bacterium]|nr:ACT domain-containing protein [Oscillospiraceae bacterium]